jgi:hypothetical protein
MRSWRAFRRRCAQASWRSVTIAGYAIRRWQCRQEVDPVFALLQAHKAAWARLLTTEERTDDHEALEAAGRAVDAALEEIMKTPPTTRAGARVITNNN